MPELRSIGVSGIRLRHLQRLDCELLVKCSDFPGVGCPHDGTRRCWSWFLVAVIMLRCSTWCNIMCYQMPKGSMCFVQLPWVAEVLVTL